MKKISLLKAIVITLMTVHGAIIYADTPAPQRQPITVHNISTENPLYYLRRDGMGNVPTKHSEVLTPPLSLYCSDSQYGKETLWRRSANVECICHSADLHHAPTCEES